MTDVSTTTTVVATVLGSLGGSAIAGFVFRLLVKRFFSENDQKHKEAKENLEKVQGEVLNEYRRLSDKIDKIVLDMGEMKSSIAVIPHLYAKVDSDHDTLVKLSTWNEKYIQDLKTQFRVIKDLKDEIKELKQ